MSTPASAGAPRARETFARVREERNLDAFPGNYGPPLVGNTFAVLFRNQRFTQRMYETYGPIYRNSVLAQRFVTLLSADAAQRLMTDRESTFSSKLGWNASLGAFFAGGLMLRDFEDHKFHRKLIQPAFRRAALEGYLPLAAAIVARRQAGLAPGQPLRFYPYVKAVTLEIAARLFLGVELGADSERLQRAFLQVVKAAAALIRRPVPGMAHWRGVRARKVLEEYLRAQIPGRRANPGADLFSQLCIATNEDGAAFSDDEIVNHLIFFMVAAHDTTASSLTSLTYELCKNPDWQERLRADVARFAPGEIGIGALESMDVVDAAFRETLRLYPAVPLIPRRTVKPVEIGGYTVPPNTTLYLNVTFIQRLAEHWPEPNRFDPARFGDGAAKEGRHPYAWFPFGGGAHMCAGFHLANLIVKLFLWHFLREYRIAFPPGYTPPDFALFPFPKPKDGLLARLEPL
ncbi:MAG: hypothetical protein QOI11_530 [Candidatus Eremiobacteraeota bacterium]|nr:hypothetical protein [Candidatus Eremiobacteraeota bacterium]